MSFLITIPYAPQIEKLHVSLSVVNEFLESIRETNSTTDFVKRNPLIDKLFNKGYWRLCRFLCLFSRSKKQVCFSVAMGSGQIIGVDFLRNATVKSLYLFDAWPAAYTKIVSIVEELQIDILFVSSRQSTVSLQKLCGKTRVVWVPEGCKAEDYCYKHQLDKKIDVLQLGRRYDLLHNQIYPFFRKKKIVYLYEINRGQIIFPTRSEFLEGLGSSKISICFPQSTTNPKYAEGVNTMTNRYLQSMASKCLVVGESAEEMKALFPYNPVIELDMDRSAQQIEQILLDYDSYQDLIEENFRQVKINHTWQRRWKDWILPVLQKGKITEFNHDTMI